MTLLALSRHLSFHARGDAAFVWHGLTGDVAEMSRDVLALLLAFDPQADDASIVAEGLSSDQIHDFVAILRSRRFLVSAGSGEHPVDEISPLLAGIPRAPRSAVFERTDKGVTLYTRAGEALPLDATTASLFLRCDGERSLGQVLSDAGPRALPPLLRLAQPDVAALKILARPVSRGGLQLNPAAESTMPYPEIPDPRAYARGAGAPEQGAQEEPTFASLFAEPHPSLGGRTYGQALLDELARRGAFERSRRLLELHVKSAIGIEGARAVDLSQQPEPHLEAETYDAIIANEIAHELGAGAASGVLARAAGALAPGGVFILVDYAAPSDSEFANLQAQAAQWGLTARVLPLPELIGLDVNAQALATTRASWPAIKALFAAHGIELKPRAWLRTEIESLAEGKLDLKSVHGLLWAPLSERASSLSPRNYCALVARKEKPQRAQGA
jgi:hypothetical protein